MATSADHNNSSGSGGDSVDLTCPVCYDTFRCPRFLPCHHTLCTDCISDLMERASPELQHFLCPLCQVKVPLPEDGVTTFQVNYYLAPFLSGRVRLEPSPQQSSDHGQNHHHQQQKSSELSCEAHYSGPWSHYCCSCCCLVCRPSCCLHQGPHHKVVPVAQEAPGQRSEVRRQLLSLTTLQGTLADLEDECHHRVAALQQSCQKVAQKVEESCKEACASLTGRAGRSRDKLEGLRGRISQVVEGERRSLQEKREAVTSLLSSANQVLASDDAQFMKDKTKLVARIQSFMSKIPPSRGQLLFSFRMSPTIETLLSAETTTIPTTTTTNAANTSTGSSGSSSGSSSSSGSGFGFLTVQFQSPVLRQRLLLSSTKQQRKLKKLCPCKDGSVLASVGNCMVTITAQFVESKRLEFPAEVVDFLPARDGYVYVALPFPHPVKRLDPKTEVAKDFVTPLSPPTAIAITDKRELILASHDSKELCLTVYSLESAARLRRVTLPLPDLSPVVAMTTASSSRQGRLFISSMYQLACLDTDYSVSAVLEEEHGSAGLRPRGLSGLRGIACGLGDVLMANSASGNVEIVELSGGQLTRKEEIIQWKRGTSEEDGDQNTHGHVHPQVSCVVLDHAGRLWVGQEDGHVALYDWLLRTT